MGYLHYASNSFVAATTIMATDAKNKVYCWGNVLGRRKEKGKTKRKKTPSIGNPNTTTHGDKSVFLEANHRKCRGMFARCGSNIVTMPQKYNEAKNVMRRRKRK